MSKILLVSAPRPNSDQSAMHMGDGRPPMGLAYISIIAGHAKAV